MAARASPAAFPRRFNASYLRVFWQPRLGGPQLPRKVPDIERAGLTKPLKEAVAPPPREIPVPDFFALLGDDSGAVALAEFNRIVPQLAKMGAAASVDALLLREYCICWARLAAIERQITREGMMVKGRGEGAFVKHPLIAAGNSYRTSARALAAQIGVGANARGLMHLTPPKKRPSDEPGIGWLPEKVK